MEYVGTETPEVTLTSPDSATHALINRIVQYAEQEANIRVKAYDRFNAEARIMVEDGKSHRYILFNPEFLKRIRESKGSDWAVIGVLAHEVEHHLLGHTVEYDSSNPTLELVADKYAGVILFKMGATLEQARSGFDAISKDVVPPGSSHPPRSQRIAAVEAGWNQANKVQVKKELSDLMLSFLRVNVEGNKKAIADMLADEYTDMDETRGETYNKSTFLDGVDEGSDSKIMSLAIEESNLLYDDSSPTLSGIYYGEIREDEVDDHFKKFRTQVTVKFIKRNGRWQFLSARRKNLTR
jgi:hypothetical protein